MSGDDTGACFTRTGRRFFSDIALENEFLERIKRALDAVDYWEKFSTDWFCFDCELMPWSVKAQELLVKQYASVGAAARTSLHAAVDGLERTDARGVDVADMLSTFKQKEAMAADYVRAYRHYCWPVSAIDDLKLAPTFRHRRRKLPSGRPDEEAVTLVQPDPTWQLEYEHFTALCEGGEGNIANDLWINRELNRLSAEALRRPV